MSDIDGAKYRAAHAAAALVENGMTVGLGSGTTSSLVIRCLGERIQREGLSIVGTASSEASSDLARSVGIRLVELDDLPSLDINLDGADEVDPQFRMIKGRGGALLREKLVATVARRRVFVVIADKLVPRLGTKAPVPVEASTFGLTHIESRIRDLGVTTSIRLQSNGSRFSTDGGNAIVDCSFPPIDDVEALDRGLRQVVGVFETGLFLDLCDLLVVGHADGVESLEKPPSGRVSDRRPLILAARRSAARST